MLAKLHSCAISGIDAAIVEVELDLSAGMPGLRIVGLPDKAVQESGDRVHSALRNAGYTVPTNRKVIVSLAPADLRKEGGVYDLPIALAILMVSEQLESERAGRYLILGELALDGSVRAVKGVLAAAITAQQRGFAGVIVPAGNAVEATVLGTELQVVGVETLQQAADFLAGEIPAPPLPEELPESRPESELCFSDVRGQQHVKRALEVAAAGGHNLLMMGPPGSGKTMSAQRIPSILPRLSFEEALETTKIYSVVGELAPGQGLMRTRPFRNPHHSVSMPGLIGGGTQARPGEVSLAHNGVLFLDEAPEFGRALLEPLRAPLEDGRVQITRASGSATFPSRFMLVLSMNMCPCGRRGDPRKACRCSPGQIANYIGRLSGPLLDRIDIHVEAPAVPYEELRGPRAGEPSSRIRTRVQAARAIQRARLDGALSPINAAMTPRQMETHCALDDAGETLLKQAIQELGLSARAHTRVLKVARTIADLAGVERIGIAHLSEAIQYRAMDRRDAY